MSTTPLATSFATPDDIRSLFSQALSAMYQAEVPLYSDLLELVARINAQTLEADAALRVAMQSRGELERLGVERHGAIRVGTAQELHTLRRLFAVMGMEPVGYYDLSVAGVPVHATAFRPVDDDALARNPFRLFTSLLRLELIEDAALREQAATLLAQRQIFTPQALDLLAQHETAGGLTPPQASAFVAAVLETFRWHSQATVSHATYTQLHRAHRLIADVVCFQGPHINHLTPRTLDIDAAQAAMAQQGMAAKAVIEGPPRRKVPILLRQTSFQALQEPVTFPDAATGSAHAGTHTARFGEIEQRGIALTRQGRALYDQLLAQTRQGAPATAPDTHYAERLTQCFSAFPDDATALRTQGLGFFRYQLAPNATRASQPSAPLPPTLHAWLAQDTPPHPLGAAHRQALEELITLGWVQAHPVVYEDFLPVSAAGIFQSNLGGAQHASYTTNADSAAFEVAFEVALGSPVHDEMALYEAAQTQSVRTVHRALKNAFASALTGF